LNPTAAAVFAIPTAGRDRLVAFAFRTPVPEGSTLTTSEGEIAAASLFSAE
jgi:hypothetical protein